MILFVLQVDLIIFQVEDPKLIKNQMQVEDPKLNLIILQVVDPRLI